MFELFFLMLAASLQTAHLQTAVSGQQAGSDTPIQSVATDRPATDTPSPAPPAFPTPAQGGVPDTASPAFLAPASPEAAPPVFLAPSDSSMPSGPALQAEPQVPTGRFTTATEVKPILNATRTNWIMVRDFNGQDLVYVTQIWSWRCGLLDLKVGINGAPPETWPLPPCHEDQATPNAILESDGLPYRAFPSGSVALVEVRLTFDDLSADGAKFNRQGVPVP